MDIRSYFKKSGMTPAAQEPKKRKEIEPIAIEEESNDDHIILKKRAKGDRKSLEEPSSSESKSKIKATPDRTSPRKKEAVGKREISPVKSSPKKKLASQPEKKEKESVVQKSTEKKKESREDKSTEGVEPKLSPKKKSSSQLEKKDSNHSASPNLSPKKKSSSQLEKKDSNHSASPNLSPKKKSSSQLEKKDSNHSASPKLSPKKKSSSQLEKKDSNHSASPNLSPKKKSSSQLEKPEKKEKESVVQKSTEKKKESKEDKSTEKKDKEDGVEPKLSPKKKSSSQLEKKEKDAAEKKDEKLAESERKKKSLDEQQKKEEERKRKKSADDRKQKELEEQKRRGEGEKKKGKDLAEKKSDGEEKKQKKPLKIGSIVVDDIEDVGALTEEDETLTRKAAEVKKAPNDEASKILKEEQKKENARKYFARGGAPHTMPPPNKGIKPPPPEGKANCLLGLNFCVTGVLDSLERDEAQELIIKYGGTVAKSGVGKRTNYVVAGLEAGEKKLAKARENKVAVIDEDGLFKLIETESKKPLKAAPAEKKKKKAKAVNVEVNPLPPTTIVVREVPTTPPAAITPEKPSKKSLLKSPAAAAVSPPVTAPTTVRQQPASEDAEQNRLWTDKYAPTKSADVVGNPGAISKLRTWLQQWKPSNTHRAALISGPPGIGKTTTAHLLARENGFDPVEFNASDTRSKGALTEKVASLCGFPSIHKFLPPSIQQQQQQQQQKQKSKQNRDKPVLIMDEVDGMSSGDRGGMRELIQLIKTTQIPIICICNDRQSTKVRSLINYCDDYRFLRPTVVQMLPRLEKICEMEKLFKNGVLDKAMLTRIAECASGDFRQILNMLQTSSNRPIDRKPGQAQELINATNKDVELSIWSIVPKLFSASTFLSLADRIEFHFADNLVPLFVYENYLHVPNATSIDAIAAAADSISQSDLVHRMILHEQHWELSQEHGVMASVRPARLVRSGVGGQVAFPAILGKISNTNKRYRLLKELQSHMSLQVSANKLEVGLDYLPMLANSLTEPLVRNGMDGIESVVSLMQEYGITRDDWDTIQELSHWPGAVDIAKSIQSDVKRKFTLAYKNLHKAMTTSPMQAPRSANVLYVDEDDEEVEAQADDKEAEEEEEEGAAADVSKDKLISRKKPPPAKKRKNSAAHNEDEDGDEPKKSRANLSKKKE